MIKAKKIAYRRCVAASCRGVRQGAAKKEWTYSKELCARGPLRSAKAPGRKAAIAGNREKVGAARGRKAAQIASQENCCLRLELRTPDPSAGRVFLFCTGRLYEKALDDTLVPCSARRGADGGVFAVFHAHLQHGDGPRHGRHGPDGGRRRRRHASRFLPRR